MKTIAAILTWMVVTSALGAGDPISSNTWSTAAALEAQGRYPEALQAYQSILATVPDSQRALVRRGVVQIMLNREAQAIQSLENALSKDGFNYWAEEALYYKAKALAQSGNSAGALRAVDDLVARFPESAWAARGDVLAATLEGTDVAAAEAAFQVELQAMQAMDAALGLDSQGNPQGALTGLQQVSQQHPMTGAALRAREAEGHILCKLNRNADAIRVFEDLVLDAVAYGADSRIAGVARTRLAALYHREKRRVDAIREYDLVVQNATDGAMVTNALLQSSGLHFEILQRRVMNGEQPPAAQWEHLRHMFQAVVQSGAAGTLENARAELMNVESYAWEDRHDLTVSTGFAFMAKYSATEFRRERAVAALFVAKALKELGRRGDAISVLSDIVTDFEGEPYIWEGMDHLPRAHFELWMNLRASGAPVAEVDAAGDALLAAFPSSSYAEHVRIIRGKEGR